MNLHGIVAPYIGVVNPLIPVTVQLSTGPSATSPDGGRTPTYATPGALIGSIAAGILTVTAITGGRLTAGDTLAGPSVLADTEIVEQLSGPDGGAGTYQLSRYYPDAVISEAMTTVLVLTAQVQPLSTGDLQHLDGLNLNTTRRKVYLYGSVDSVSRVKRTGGDLITIEGGVNDGVWLVSQVLEQFPDWVSAAITLQNGS